MNTSQIDSLLRVLTLHCKDMGYTIDDLKGIHRSVRMHHIWIEEDHKPSIEYQRRLNPNIKEVV